MIYVIVWVLCGISTPAIMHITGKFETDKISEIVGYYVVSIICGPLNWLMLL